MNVWFQRKHTNRKILPYLNFRTNKNHHLWRVSEAPEGAISNSHVIFNLAASSALRVGMYRPRKGGANRGAFHRFDMLFKRGKLFGRQWRAGRLASFGAR